MTGAIVAFLFAVLMGGVAGQDTAKKEPTPPSMEVYYLALLYRGGNWTPDQTPEVQRLQEEHMANIRRLAASGKLILAGPFEEDGELRGLFLLRASSLKEAREVCDNDPAIKAGRLKAEVHAWWGPKGIRIDSPHGNE